MLFIEFGWAHNINKFDPESKHFNKIKEYLSKGKDELIYFNNKIIISKSLRKTLIKTLHESHLGLEKTKSVAREIIYSLLTKIIK